MSTPDLNQTSPGSPGHSVRLINSINELPWFGGRPEEAYVVSDKAMKEITEELRRLWDLREALADTVRRAHPENSTV